MDILLTNDDGYEAPGLEAAYRALQGMGTVHVVAPSSERSACGHMITLKGPIMVRRHEHPLFGRAWSVDGSPADCVRLALFELIGKPVQLTVSGINRGANAGVDTYYSGTIAAAREAAFCGIKSIAFSHATRRDVELDWGRASALTSRLTRELLHEELPGPGFWSVNFPAPMPAEGCERICRVPVSTSPMPMAFERKDMHDGCTIEFDYLNPYWERKTIGPCDFSTIRDGGISVTAVPLFGKF